MKHQMAPVIATRELMWKLSDGTETPVTINLGRPLPHEDIDWYCTFQIVGLGDETVRAMYGVDGFQAIQSAVKIIDVFLATSPAGKSKQICWTDGTEFEFNA